MVWSVNMMVSVVFEMEMKQAVKDLVSNHDT